MRSTIDGRSLWSVDDLEAQAKLVAAVMVIWREFVDGRSVVGASGGGKFQANEARGAREENANGGDGRKGNMRGRNGNGNRRPCRRTGKRHASVLRSVIEPEGRGPDDHADEIETLKFP